MRPAGVVGPASSSGSGGGGDSSSSTLRAAVDGSATAHASQVLATVLQAGQLRARLRNQLDQTQAINDVWTEAKVEALIAAHDKLGEHSLTSSLTGKQATAIAAAVTDAAAKGTTAATVSSVRSKRAIAGLPGDDAAHSVLAAKGAAGGLVQASLTDQQRRFAPADHQAQHCGPLRTI